MVIKPTVDSFGNRTCPEIVLEAVKTDEAGSASLKELLPTVTRDIDVVIDTKNWIQASGTAYGFYKDFTVEDIRESDYPFYVLKPAGNNVASSDEEASFSRIMQVETGDGFIKVYVNEIPASDISILLKNIPNRSFIVSE